MINECLSPVDICHPLFMSLPKSLWKIVSYRINYVQQVFQFILESARAEAISRDTELECWQEPSPTDLI